MSTNRLMLCAGPSRRDGWLTLDGSSEHRPDILATIPPLPDEVKARKWDEVELIHGISSFYPWEAEQLLREIKSVLAPGGKLVLEQPDIKKCAQRFLDNGPLYWLFGDPQHQSPGYMNKWGYTPESLTSLLHECGFTVCQTKPAQHHHPTRDFRIEAQ